MAGAITMLIVYNWDIVKSQVQKEEQEDEQH